MDSLPFMTTFYITFQFRISLHQKRLLSMLRGPKHFHILQWVVLVEPLVVIFLDFTRSGSIMWKTHWKAFFVVEILSIDSEDQYLRHYRQLNACVTQCSCSCSQALGIDIIFLSLICAQWSLFLVISFFHTLYKLVRLVRLFAITFKCSLNQLW